MIAVSTRGVSLLGLPVCATQSPKKMNQLASPVHPLLIDVIVGAGWLAGVVLLGGYVRLSETLMMRAA